MGNKDRDPSGTHGEHNHQEKEDREDQDEKNVLGVGGRAAEASGRSWAKALGAGAVAGATRAVIDKVIEEAPKILERLQP